MFPLGMSQNTEQLAPKCNEFFMQQTSTNARVLQVIAMPTQLASISLENLGVYVTLVSTEMASPVQKKNNVLDGCLSKTANDFQRCA